MGRKQELAKNTVILTVGKICTQFVSFMLLPLYTALLSAEEYGIVDLFNTYVILLVPLFNWQFENGLFRFMLDCRNDKKKTQELFSTVLTTNFIQVFGYLLLYFIVQRFLHTEYKIFLAIDVALNILLNTMMQFPRGIGKNSVYAFASFLSASATVVLNVILIVVFHLGAYGLFIATAAAKLLTLAYLVVCLRVWQYYRPHYFSINAFKEISRYSIPLIPNSLSWWIIGASDRSVIARFIGIAANGVFSVANKFSGLFSTFFSIFNLSWTESVALHIKDEDHESFLTEMINQLFCIFAAVCFGIIACMPFVFPFMIDAKYSAAYPQIPILMVGILFQIIMGLYSTIYVALKKSVEVAKTTLYAAVINLMVDFGLINHIGIYAASLSTLAAFAFVAIYRYFHVQRYVSVKFTAKVKISTILAGVFVIVAYYYNNFFLNIVSLLVAISYALTMNWSFVKAIFGAMKSGLGRIVKK